LAPFLTIRKTSPRVAGMLITWRGNAKVAQIFSPKEREMMKYSPPSSTRLLVAISDMASAVRMVTRCPSRIIPRTP
jgi:hypothetical protein